jgi:NADPH2:quinone reductase
VAGRRVVVHAFAASPAEALERQLTLEPMAPPDPAALGPRDVVVDVKSAQVGWVDLLMTSGQYQHMPRPPYTPGLEGAGVVSWVGPEADGVVPGQAVLIDPFFVGPRSLGAYQSFGTFASWVVAPAEGVLPIPGGLSLDQAAGLLSSYETAYHCLITRGRLQAGETVLIHGASGATGLAAVEVARLCGARVIATGRSDPKLAVVAAAGADHVLNVSAEGGGVRRFRDEVKALTGGRGVEVVYDGVGGEISLESLRCVDFGARFLIVGWASTPDVADGQGKRGAPRANQLPTNLVMMKSLDVLGCPTAISTARDPATRAPRLAAVLAWAEAGRIRPHVSHVFPLEQYREAMAAKWRGEVIGSCVLRV